MTTSYKSKYISSIKKINIVAQGLYAPISFQKV
jgi:hypothetical protein